MDFCVHIWENTLINLASKEPFGFRVDHFKKMYAKIVFWSFPQGYTVASQEILVQPGLSDTVAPKLG